MNTGNWKALPLVLVLGLLALTGCNSAPPSPADAEQARVGLRRALEAWKQGAALEGFSKESSVTFVDSKWEQGYRLVGYELAGDGERVGYDWQCKARLSLQDAKGKPSQEKAIYCVATSPTLVIVRSEAPE